MDKKTEDLIPKCFYCHTPLIWQSDEMAQGLYEDAGADDLIQFYNYDILLHSKDASLKNLIDSLLNSLYPSMLLSKKMESIVKKVDKSLTSFDLYYNGGTIWSER